LAFGINNVDNNSQFEQSLQGVIWRWIKLIDEFFHWFWKS